MKDAAEFLKMNMEQVVLHPEYQEQMLLTHPTMQKD